MILSPLEISYLFFFFPALRTAPRALRLPGKHPTIELNPQISYQANVPGEPRITYHVLKIFVYPEPGVTGHACNVRTQGVETGRWGLRSPPEPHSEFKANMSSMRPFLKD